jgi:uncharacterized protein YqeY
MKSQIEADLKQAQLNKDELATATLRLLLSELKYAELKQSTPLSDQEVLSVLQREVKKRRESIEAFTNGNRPEMAEKELAEAKILEKYLPEQISDSELTNLIETTITEVGATTMADMGKVIAEVMPKVSGRAEGSRVSAMVKAKLGL